MNTDGFVSSISKFRNNNIRLLNKIHITRAVHVSEQPFSRKLQEEIAGGDCKFWMFSAPPMVSPSLQILVCLWVCIFTENLYCCIWMFSELMNWASCEVLSPLYREGDWEREVTFLKSNKVSGELWKMYSSSSLGGGSFFYPVTILVPSGCAIFRRVQQFIDPLALGLVTVSWGGFCSSSTPYVKSLSCSLSDL